MKPTKKYCWIRVPVPTELNSVNVYEHTLLDYYRYGEYPRFIRPVRDEMRWEWKRVEVK